MMLFCRAILPCIALFSGLGAAQVTWPNTIDELEDVMFLGTGFLSRGFPAFVTPCSFSAAGAGRQTAAEWLRAGFHDMATTDIYYLNKGPTGVHGGIDASLAFELNDGENIGAGFNTTFTTYSGFFNSRLPVSDLVALGVYASVRACSGPIIPMRGGRIDATQAGPIGVPQPQNGIGQFTNQFARMGFNVTQMIQMTACGHTLGGVHAGDFNNIVAPGTVANDFQLFDNTETFDNNIATRYINGPDTDPLAVGISVSSGRNSDFAVFNADNNVTLQAMTVPATFNSMCISILQQMIETVPPTVTLSPIIVPYEVKPAQLQLTLLSGGTQLTFSGYIRVRTTVRSASQISSVQLLYTDRNGNSVSTPINTAAAGTAQGFDDNFSFYSFSVNLPVATSISSFNVLITSTSGTTQTYNNNGSGGFPVSDSVIVQTPQSCVSNGNLTVVAAVRSSVTSPVNMTITQKVARNSGSPTPSPVPSLVSSTISMAQGAVIGPYTIYTASYSIASVVGAKYGVAAGSYADSFKDPALLGSTCGAISTSAPSSSVSSTTSSSSISSSVSTTSTSATTTPTLAIKSTVGSYSFQGCYTEATNVRALSAASFYNYSGMTLEQCATDCVGYNYWGVEYGGECYCGNSLNTGSVYAPNQGDCNFVCPGNQYEYCGAGNRLELYLLSSLASSSSSSSVASSTSSSSSSSVSLSTSSVKSSTSSTSTKSSTSSPSSSSTSSVATSTSSTSKSVTSTSTTSTPTTSTSTAKTSTASVSTTISSATSTSLSPSVSPTLGIKQIVGAYTYQGCYTEATNMRALSSASYYDYSAMTLEECANDCTGYVYFGVEYGGECYCGNSLNPGSVYATDQGDCSFVCPGNQYEYCGAGNRLDLYMVSSVSSAKTSSSSTAKSSTSSSSTGSSSTSVPTTTSKTSTSASSSSSSRVSTSSASTAKTSTSSSSTGSSSTSVPTTTSKTSTSASSSSSSLVSTSSTSTSKLTTLTTSTTSATPTQTAPAIKPTIGNYAYYGCQTEATNTRALNAASYYNYNAMTLEMCASDCTGYTYWGVEYGGECYCGNSFNAGSVNATGSDCSFLCPGNDLEYCGAGNRLSTYYLT